MATKANLPEKPEVKRELRTVPLDWLKPYENNPRIIENAVPLVEESMRQAGYVTPIVADEDGVILAGHTRFAALKELGKTEVQVVVITGATDDQKKKYRILDNKTGELATWDNLLLKSELEDVDFGGFDFGQPVKPESFADISDGTFVKSDREPLVKVVTCPRCGSEVPL